jgi:hypothetical protein
MIAGHCARSDPGQFLLPFQGSVLQNRDHIACQYTHNVLYRSLAHNCRENRNDRIILLATQAQCAKLLKWPTYIQLYGLLRDGTKTYYVLKKRASKDVKWIDDSGNSPISDLCGCTSHSWDFEERISLPDESLPRVQERFCTTELTRPSVRRWELKGKTNQYRKHRTGYYVYQCPQNIFFWFWFIRGKKDMMRWN